MNGRNYGEKSHVEQYEKRAAGCSGLRTDPAPRRTFFLFLALSLPFPGGSWRIDSQTADPKKIIQRNHTFDQRFKYGF